MKTMKIFEPAMCCPTGLCGVSVDPELLRISTVLNTLQQNGIEVQRFNLTSAPAEFVKNKAVTEYLQKFAPEKLPVVLVDDFIVIADRYPTNEEFTSWLELPGNMLGVSCCEEKAAEESCCCCGDTSSNDECCSDSCCTETEDTDCCCNDGQESCCSSEESCSDTSESKGCCCNEGRC